VNVHVVLFQGVLTLKNKVWKLRNWSYIFIHSAFINVRQLLGQHYVRLSLPCSSALRTGYIGTVLVLTQVACNISGKENAMGIWCDIQSHPTRPCPLPHPKPRPHIFNTFVPAKRTNRVADLQERLFSFFFLDSSKYTVKMKGYLTHFWLL